MKDKGDRNRLLVITEHFLVKWLARRNKENASCNGSVIHEQAKVLYAAIARKKNIKSPPPFNASVGWLGT